MNVWRGYNGHVYFEPIKYTRLENERDIYSVNTNDAPFRLNKNSKRHSLAHDTRSRQQQTKRSYTTSSTRKPKTSAVLNSHKIIIDGPLSIIKGKSIISKPSSTTQYEQHRQQNIATQFSNHSLLNDPCIVADETVSITESPSKLNNNTLETFVQQELNENMWQSVKTCAPIQIKPISKRSKHLIEDMQHLQQEQNIQDPTGYYRQVLPNIKPIPKYKNIYKGLAYKEGKKIASNNSENDAPKPLVSYNLAQAYARFEINASKNKGQQKQQEQQQTPFNTPFKEQTPTATNYDIKEMRKRIVRGTTLAYRPPPVTGNWTPGRGGGGSESAASVSNVKVKGELITKAPMLNHVLFLQSSHMPVNMTTVDSNHKQVSLIDCTNITSPFTKTSRVQTHNIRSRTHYTTPNQSQQQSRIFSLTPNFVTLGQTMIVS
ncbi:unnamed protein product [Didymodactylos carnosus]|uniref:Uncharacterized protein n=1 Tax=Didymodactylos carnosus TaxID=1234261 RepID=A0A813TK00_9BILA|nr:unnamed protein product [Didymodactylos carnosus]CAF3600930.1 unnamed protein product [Didymodactylos carnosus]